MAVRVGIQFEECRGSLNTGGGNPFYCPPCQSYWNHGAASLEKHLSSFHRHSVAVERKLPRMLPPQTVPLPQTVPPPQMVPPPPPPLVPSSDVAVKRKQCDEFEEPILFVSGCSHSDIVSSIIKGKYTAKRWHHGKPVYEKDKPDKLPQITPVLIYFWKDTLEPEMSGWWFSRKEGDSHVWAHHANCDPECLTVPKAGWKAPWDGEVDAALEIATEEIEETNQTNQTQTNQTSQPDFELRWQFLVADEPDEEWKFMSQEMNNALEKRWAQGWDGDNGKLGGMVSVVSVFFVRGNLHQYE